MLPISALWAFSVTAGHRQRPRRVRMVRAYACHRHSRSRPPGAPWRAADAAGPAPRWPPPSIQRPPAAAARGVGGQARELDISDPGRGACRKYAPRHARSSMRMTAGVSAPAASAAAITSGAPGSVAPGRASPISIAPVMPSAITAHAPARSCGSPASAPRRWRCPAAGCPAANLCRRHAWPPRHRAIAARDHRRRATFCAPGRPLGRRLIQCADLQHAVPATPARRSASGDVHGIAAGHRPACGSRSG